MGPLSLVERLQNNMGSTLSEVVLLDVSLAAVAAAVFFPAIETKETLSKRQHPMYSTSSNGYG